MINKIFTCFTFFLTFGLLVGCSKAKDPAVVPIISDTVKIDTPFANVPDGPDVTMYQVNTRAFSASRDFKGVINRLDQIKALGVNVIYLMPIYPVGILNSVNSPYCVKDYTSVASEFGNLDDLRILTTGAHTRGMAIILDWVGNHTSWDNSWIKNKSWYVQNASGNIISPSGWSDVAQLNYNNSDMRAAMIKAMKYWVNSANIDGFRCDAADLVPVDFWKQAIDTLRAIKTHKLLMMAEGVRVTNFTAGFDFNFGFAYYEALKSINKTNQPVSILNNLNTSEYIGSFENSRVIRYITNHDVNSSDDVPQNLFGGNKGALAAFITAAYMKGVPMIYNGQEVASSTKIIFPFTSSSINWNINEDITAQYTAIIKFRNQSNAIRRGVLSSLSTSDICAFTKEIDSEKVFVLSNLRDKSISFTIPATLIGSAWKDALTGTSRVLENTIQLSPYSFIILKNN